MSHRSPTFPLKKRFPCQVESIKRHDVSSNVCRRFQPYGLHRRKMGRVVAVLRSSDVGNTAQGYLRVGVGSTLRARLPGAYLRIYVRMRDFIFLFYFREPAPALQADG